MTQNKLKQIEETTEKILLVEGKDEENFFKILLQYIEIDQDIQIISYDGKNNLKNNLSAIKLDKNFNKLTALAIIQDADEDAQNTFEKICSALNNHDLPKPDKISLFTNDVNILRVGVFTLPDGKNTGMLESLFLSTVEQTDIFKQCVEPFINCIKTITSTQNQYKKPKNIHKARCRAFLSAMEDDTPSLGIAAQKKYWNLESDKLQPLYSFLNRLK